MQQKKLILVLNKFIKKNIRKIYLLIIILNSIIFTYFSGLRGVYPIDSFLIFNSGYNILNGFYPFKDYWSITGPFVDYLQFIFFYFFGVNWISYILHSATINTLLALISYHFFNQLGLKLIYSVFFSLSISILAYPSAGTPFMDHHAAILSLISVFFLILGIKKKKNLYWFFLPIFIGSSFFSKQIPVAYLGVYFIFIIVIYLFKDSKQTHYLKSVFFGIIIYLILCYFLIISNNIPIQNIIEQYLYYPVSIGNDRVQSIEFNFNNVFFQFKFIYISLIPIIIILFNILKKPINSLDEKEDVLILFLVIGSVLIFLYSQIITKNQILIFFLIPFCLGLSLTFLKNHIKNKLIINLILVIMIFTTLKYHHRFNVERKFMELSNVNFDLAEDSFELDHKLKGLKWISPGFADPKQELSLLKNIKNQIISDGSKKIIITDYQIFPAITNIKSFAPNKWFDILSVPNKKNKYFLNYKNFFIKKLEQQNIEKIYIVGNEKLIFLMLIFENKNCLELTEINELLTIIDVKNCLKNLS